MPRAPIRRWGIIVAISLIAWAAWAAEIALVHGASRMGWLSSYPLSGLLGALLGAACVVLALPGERPSPSRHVAMVVMGLAVSFGAAFTLARTQLYSLYGDTVMIGMTDPAAARLMFLGSLLAPVATAATAAVLATLLLRQLSRAVRWRTAPFLTLAFGFALWIPSLALRGDLPRAVKEGGPVALACFFSALAVAFGARTKSDEVTLLPFEPRLAERVQQLISGIQRDEFGIPITLEDQPDLFNIPNVYHRGVGEFWVATSGERVVGTIALFDLGLGQAALRKMFVASDFRGAPHRVGQRLLDRLLVHARAHGVQRIALGTTDALRAAHRFYEKNGFVEIPRESLPANWPHNAVDVRFYERRPV